jgi:hypothetical protein
MIVLCPLPHRISVGTFNLAIKMAPPHGSDDWFYRQKEQDPWCQRSGSSDRSFDFGLGRWPVFPSLLSDSFAMGLGDETDPAWVVPYILFSPYSPLHMEQSLTDRRSSGSGVLSALFSSKWSSVPSTTLENRREPQWRHAFEDLLRLENGKPMLSNSFLADTITKGSTENGMDWLRSLVKRGSLGDSWKLVAGPYKNSSDGVPLEQKTEQHDDGFKWSQLSPTSNKNANSSSKEAATELDLYDRFPSEVPTPDEPDGFHSLLLDSPLMRLLVGKSEQRLHREAFEQMQTVWDEMGKVPPPEASRFGGSGTDPRHSSSTASELRENPSPAYSDKHEQPFSYFLSTTTKVDRLRRPDGSVETKTVKTQRFADGREESSETVEVVHPRERNQLYPAAEVESDVKQVSKSKPQRGWFWNE